MTDLVSMFDGVAGRLDLPESTRKIFVTIFNLLNQKKRTIDPPKEIAPCIFLALRLALDEESNSISLLSMREGNYNPPSLLKILAECGVESQGVMEFFKTRKELINVLHEDIHAVWEYSSSEFKVAESKYILFQLLFKKFQKTFAKIFCSNYYNNNNAMFSSSSSANSDHTENAAASIPEAELNELLLLFEFSWTLLVLIIGRLNYEDKIMQAFHAAISCLFFGIAHTSQPLRDNAIKNLNSAISPHPITLHQQHQQQHHHHHHVHLQQPDGPSPTHDSLNNTNVLQQLCEAFECNYEDVSRCYENLIFMFPTFPGFELYQSQESTQQHPIHPDRRIRNHRVVPGLIGQISRAHIDNLNNILNATLIPFGCVDGRVALTQVQRTDWLKYETTGLRHGSKSLPTSPGGLDNTPYRRNVKNTPTSAVLFAATWLGEHSNETEATNPELLQFFADCDKDPRGDIAARISRLLDKLGTIGIRDENLDRTKKKCTMLYYSSLRTFLTSEKHRTQRSNFTSMLNNEIFHKSLLAVCLALVFDTYATKVDVPILLQQWELQALQLLYMIEHYIQHVPRLPEMLQLHLRDVGDSVVESIAWDNSSMIYTTLEDQAAQEAFRTSLSSVNIRPPATPSRTPIRAPVTPSRLQAAPSTPFKAFNPLRFPSVSSSSSSSSGQDGGGGGSNPASGGGGDFNNNNNQQQQQQQQQMQQQGGSVVKRPVDIILLQTFAKRLMNRVHMRLKELWRYLDQLLSPSYPKKCELLFARLIQQSDGRDLVRDRHLDQLLACIMFSVANVTEGSKITFKKLIEVFKSANAPPARFREVLSDNPAVPIDIINFYNKIFIPKAKTTILTFNDSNEANATSPPMSPSSGFPCKFGGGPNGTNCIIVSPMRSSASSSLNPQQQQQQQQSSLTHTAMTPNTKRLFSFEEYGWRTSFQDDGVGNNNNNNNDLLEPATRRGAKRELSYALDMNTNDNPNNDNNDDDDDDDDNNHDNNNNNNDDDDDDDDGEEEDDDMDDDLMDLRELSRTASGASAASSSCALDLDNLQPQQKRFRAVRNKYPGYFVPS